ncbi:hypothetical protein [Lichenibacterium dinghuense]|uniref:hypothetical protein n=1 Tax=Lichenibacterium dinghuense TaxID=2895977 RepID=UPI001F35460D|nr:hypothetical protein [Lichenibacterium sp. 6Y81]
MTTADEQAILDLADGRCPTNCREFRWVRADGIFNVGWLARFVNLGMVQALNRRLTPEMVATMAIDVVPLSQSDQVGAFADLTLAAPCLGYARPDGTAVLIDGLKRARQSFASGHPDVPAKIMMLDDARKLGTSAEHRKLWKVLEATEHHPVGARQKRNFDRAIVELSDDREAETPGRGQPSFSDDQNVLSCSATYHLVALIEVEFYIYRTHPGSALFGHIRRGLTRPVWIEAFLRELNRSGRLPVAHNTSEVAN